MVSHLSKKLYYLSNAVERSLSWNTNVFTASEEIPCIVWNFKVHYHIDKNPPSVPVLSQMKQLNTNWSLFFEYISILFSVLCFDLQKSFLPSGFLTKSCILFYSPSCVLLSLPVFFNWPWCVRCNIICQGVQIMKPMGTGTWWS
jgi:hypothetical protein